MNIYNDERAPFNWRAETLDIRSNCSAAVPISIACAVTDAYLLVLCNDSYLGVRGKDVLY